MFNDNGDVFKDAAIKHVQSGLAVMAAAMETLDPQVQLRMSELMGQGAQLAVLTVAPGGDEGPVDKYGLWHPDAGFQEFVTVALPKVQPHH